MSHLAVLGSLHPCFPLSRFGTPSPTRLIQRKRRGLAFQSIRDHQAGGYGPRCGAKGELLIRFHGLSPESQGQNLVLAVL